MNNAKGLLDQFLGQIQGGSAGSGASGDAASGGGALGGGASSALNQVRDAAGQFDLQGLLQGKSGLITGAAAGGLAGLLLGSKKPRKIAGTALKVGGVALVGGLAYKAW
ncbi:MAG: DUF533 domain-containing protein, partial [Pseudomonadota bacterium]